MGNNDYNEQNPYAKTIDETAEEYNQFHTNYGADGRDSNGSYAYNNYDNYSNYNNYGNYGNYSNYNGNGGYTNMGGTVVDRNGKALKNNFGIQLTFSILEMLCCCTSCITLIMGIIACVFTCQANSCYIEGRYEEFKSKAKTSTILLIVGGIFAAISIVVNIFVWDTFMYEFEKALEEELGTDIDMDTFWDDVNEGKYDDLFDELLDEDEYYSDYIEGVYHLDADDFNYIALG